MKVRRQRGHTCLECQHFNNDSAWLEETYAGLSSLSSAWGCVRGDAGICSYHEVYLFPRGRCAQFVLEDGDEV